MAEDSVIQEVDEILAAFVEAEEAGEPVSRSDLFRRHPDVAEELRSFFADRDRFQRLAGPVAPGLAASRYLPAAIRYFGDYELLEELAQGGMGVLYKARQTSLDRIVAVKMILAGHLATEADIRRFTEEARTAASLKHKGIVPIHEVGRHNGQHYFSMDLIEGRNLAEVIRTERPSPQEAARIVQAVAEAVHYAHGEGIIHRDLKPSNILLDQAGHVQVTDFGLAMRVDGDSNLTRTGQCLGTPSYMSPEQATAHRGRVGPAADVYAMGAVLYELLTGRPPFRGETVLETLQQVIDAEPLSPRALEPRTPRDLATICLKCLEKDPGQRYASAERLADDLGRYLAMQPIHARPVSTAGRALRWCRRNPALASLQVAVTALLLLLGVGGALGAAWQARIASEREVIANQLGAALREAQEAKNELEETAERETEARELERQARLEVQASLRITEALRLVALSANVGQRRPVLSLLLAIEAAQATRGDSIDAGALGILENAPSIVAGHPLGRHKAEVSDVATSPDGRWIAVASGASVHLWPQPPEDPTIPVHTLKDGDSVLTSIAISADSHWLATVNRNGELRLWQIGAAELADKPAHIGSSEGFITCLKFDPAHRWLAIAMTSGVVRLIDLQAEGFSTIRLRCHETAISGLAFHADGRWLVTGTEDTLVGWDLHHNDPSATARKFAGQSGWPTTLLVHQDNLITGSSDGRVRVWDMRQRHANPTAADWHAHRGSITAMQVSRDGRWLASVSDGGSPRLWNLDSEDPQASSRVLVAGEEQVRCLAFSPNSDRLAAGGADGIIRVWSLDEVASVASMHALRLRGHEERVTSLTIDTGGRWVVSGSRDKTARIWDLDASSVELRASEFKRLGKEDPDRLIARVGELAGRDLTPSERRTYLNPEALRRLVPFDNSADGRRPMFPNDTGDHVPPWALGDEPFVQSGDWPMAGGTSFRNMVSSTTPVTLDFQPAQNVADARNMAWTKKLGSQTYPSPIVADGRVFVGTNNGGGYRPKHPADQDRGVLLCFDEETGEFLWQLTREKLPQGTVNDWPEQGIYSRPCVEGERMWVVTNRAELMCLDTKGFHDGENDRPFTSETGAEQEDADIVWSLDMIEELGVFPHNLAVSSPVVHGDLVFVVTGNGVDEAHLEVPTPRAPAFLAVNKHTGEVAWEDNSPFDQILHGQWSSPTIGIVNGRAQVYMPGGDGWLYAFEPETGELIWKFDLNPKDSKWKLGGRGTRNSIISMPVFCDNSIVLGAGQDPEHGEGVGHLYRIDATKSGDLSPQLPDGSPNPNSGQIWHFGGWDKDGSVTGEKGRLIFRRTLSTAAIHDGLVYAPDLTGYLHCLDFETGERYWEHDMLAAVWGSPMVVDGKVLLGDEDGDLVILQTGKKEKVLAEKLFPSSFYSSPTIANGRLFITDRSRLYVFDVQ